MPKINRHFDLSIEDIDMIEAALHIAKRDLSLERIAPDAVLPDSAEADPLRQIDELLGRLHNQKLFYRPNKGAYLGG